MRTFGRPCSTRTLFVVRGAVAIVLTLTTPAIRAAEETSSDSNVGGQTTNGLGRSFALPDERSSHSNTGGQALATRLRSLRPPENSEVTGLLLIKRRGRPPVERVPIVCRVMVRDDGWDSIYETGTTAAVGAQKLVIKHYTNAPSAYLYAASPAGGSAVPELKPLTREHLDTPLAGSDFWCDELGLEFLFWPDQTSLKGEMRLGQPCYVLESRDTSGRRIKSWIDKESVEQGAPGLLIAESYNPKDELIKEFNLGGGSFKKVNGVWQLQRMKISSVKQRSETELKFNLEESKKLP